MATDRHHHEESLPDSLHATRVLSLPANGKVSIAHLVEEGLLTPGNVVVCNNWPYSSIVTATGTFDARWEPLPDDFIAPYGTEFMRPGFETPSAWATAVCRVMRAQARAQKLNKQPSAVAPAPAVADGDVAGSAQKSPLLSNEPNEVSNSGRRGTRGKPLKGSSRSGSSGGSGESRVAVNGWTACRVLYPKGDPNRALALRLDSEARADRAGGGAAAEKMTDTDTGSLGSDKVTPAAIEITLDALRRELCARISRTRAAKRASESVKQQQQQQPRKGTHSYASSLGSLVDGSGRVIFAEPHGGDDSDGDFEHKSNAAVKRTSAELSEISGAVDGLAKRVESDLALGCVKQRRAAAAAADAISASAHVSSMSSYIQVAAHVDDDEAHQKAATFSVSRKQSQSSHSRKRKSIPDMSRHAKLSRVPTENSDADNGGNGASSMNTDEVILERMHLSEQSKAVLAYFQAKATDLDRPQNELKAMRYQRKQQLKRRISSALDMWLHQQRRRTRHRRAQKPDIACFGQSLGSAKSTFSFISRPPSPSLAHTTTTTSPKAIAQPLLPPPVKASLSSSGSTISDGEGMHVDALSSTIQASYADVSTRIACTLVPRASIYGEECCGPLSLCTQCGSAGESLRSCSSCGDKYHDFCVGLQDAQRNGKPFLCPACRICRHCLDDTPVEELLHCDKCGLFMHARCSSQRTQHRDGLLGLALENGRWVCDGCVCCLECGFTMSSADESKQASDDDNGTASSTENKALSEWKARVLWAYDFGMCGVCAQQIERGKVCPECVATYANCHISANMVCCDICTAWVHTECDSKLTPEVYDALITLEDAPYVCPTCCNSTGAAPIADRGDADSDSAENDNMLTVPGLPRCLKSYSIKAEPDTQTSMENSPNPPISNGELSLLHQVNALNLSQPLVTTVATPMKSRSLSIKHEPETEAANMLLSLTQSDVRFDRERLDIETLESHFCINALPTLASTNKDQKPARDTRKCTLCGLRGDGLADKTPSLGRLIPLASPSSSSGAWPRPAPLSAASHWVHVECLAWAWGPRPVTVSSAANGNNTTTTTTSGHNTPALAAATISNSPLSGNGSSNGILLVRFEGGLLDNESKADLACTLCGRAGASFHCCAPVACSDTAYHLPCLLFVGSPLSTHNSADQPLYCAGWRRALCPGHVPMFSAMLPADGAIESASYSNVRVDACLDNLPDTSPSDMDYIVRIGNLAVLNWGEIPTESADKAEAMDCSDEYTDSTNGVSFLDPVAVTAEFPRWVIPPSGFCCIRYFDLGGKQYSMQVGTVIHWIKNEKVIAPDMPYPVSVWRGSIQPGIASHADLAANKKVEASSLSKLVSLLLGQAINLQSEAPPHKDDLVRDTFVSFATSKPFRFLGLARCKLYDLFVHHVQNYDQLCSQARMARTGAMALPLQAANTSKMATAAIPIPNSSVFANHL